MNVILSYNAILGDWVDDREGGFDLWWELEYFFDAPNAHKSKTGTKSRAADVWQEGGTWSWTAYHPLSGQIFASGHQFKTPDAAKARCLESVDDHFCNQEPTRI